MRPFLTLRNNNIVWNLRNHSLEQKPHRSDVEVEQKLCILMKMWFLWDDQIELLDDPKNNRCLILLSPLLSKGKNSENTKTSNDIGKNVCTLISNE